MKAAVIGAAALIVAAVLGAVLPKVLGSPAPVGSPSVPAPSASTPRTTPIRRVPTVSITSPTKRVSCQQDRPQCRFEAAGRWTGVTSNMDIFVLVFPVRPGGSSGHGWYIQQFPASVAANGHWTESPAYLGSAKAPVHTGDTLQIEAIVVRRGASYQGTPLGTRAHQVGRSLIPGESPA